MTPLWALLAARSCNFDRSRRDLTTSVPAARWGGDETTVAGPKIDYEVDGSIVVTLAHPGP